MKHGICICGAGQQGMAMAAHLSLSGVQVALWNRSRENVLELIDGHPIECTGVVEGNVILTEVSDNIAEVVRDLVMVVTPASAHCDVARVLAPFVSREMTIVLNPGRTFGAYAFRDALIREGVRDLPRIAEAQTIVYTCRRTSATGVKIIGLKNSVALAALDGVAAEIISLFPECLRTRFVPADSIIATSMSNVGMILHCAPVLMNVGWIETESVDFKYYYDGISRTVADFLEKLDAERLSVARALGVEVESVCEWLRHVYNAEGDDLYTCLRSVKAYREIDAPHTVNTRYLTEDIPCGLVPVESAGIQYGISTPCISLVIDLANVLLGVDFRKEGRKVNSVLIERHA